MYEGEKIASFTDLNIGDYVVHENHGLGIYRGIEKIEVDKTVKDYIKIEYAGGGNLYILATQLELIQKYAGADAKKPKLNKLGGQEWNKTKTKSAEQSKRLPEIWCVYTQCGRVSADLPMVRIRSGSVSLRRCSRSRRRKIRTLRSRLRKRYGEHEDHGSSDLRRRWLW